MVLFGVKDTTSAANTDYVEPSVGKLEIGISRPLEKGITIKFWLHADIEAYRENKNSDYKRKGKRKISSNDPIRDSTHQP